MTKTKLILLGIGIQQQKNDGLNRFYGIFKFFKA